MANKNTYIIIDEPKVRFLENMIVNPIIVLFAAMILPLFIKIPFFGRWWLPFVWLIFNGFIMGSPHIKKEIIYSIIGLTTLVIIFYSAIYIINLKLQLSFSIVDYLIILMNAIFFLFLYLIVFTQQAPYQIYQYTRSH